MRIIRNKMLYFFLATAAALAMHCGSDVVYGGFQEGSFLNALNKVYNTFLALDFLDLIALVAVYLLYCHVTQREERVCIYSAVLAGVFSLLLILCISYRQYDSAIMVFGNTYQSLLSILRLVGYGALFYGVIREIEFLLTSEVREAKDAGGKWAPWLRQHFLVTGFLIILIGWLPWLLLNYPGSGCGDSVVQLKEFFGEGNWGAAHPPLSTVIMGMLFVIGKSLWNANFGFFLYCLFQSLVGAWVFSLSMKTALKLGVPMKLCFAGIAFFAFTPLWGTYAQWFEKDLLFTEITVLQVVCMLEILRKRMCGVKDAVCLTLASLGAVFLRNNGIYMVFPALVMLAFVLKGEFRRNLVASAITVLLFYEGVTRVLFPALGIVELTMAESFSIPFQQTARYVYEHEDEVTEYEKQVIEETLNYDAMFEYDPRISDPIKIHYSGGELGEYLGIWFQMLLKHPETYAEAFLNQAYGYLAPVETNIEAWIQQVYYDYQTELGMEHVLDQEYSDVLVQIWNISMVMPLLRYLCTPGFYTWGVVLLSVMMVKRRKWSELIILTPAIINILICIASPMANAIRYELPVVAIFPMLIGWTYASMRQGGIKEEKLHFQRQNGGDHGQFATKEICQRGA